MFSFIKQKVLYNLFFFFQAEDGIRDYKVTGVQTCALPISTVTIRIWEAATAQVRHTLKGHGRVVACAAFGPDGRSLTTADLDGMVKQWDVATGQQQKSFKIEFDVEGTSIDLIACSRDGNRLFVLDALVGEGTMWDVATGKLLGTLRRAP